MAGRASTVSAAAAANATAAGRSGGDARRYSPSRSDEKSSPLDKTRRRGIQQFSLLAGIHIYTENLQLFRRVFPPKVM